MPKNRRFRTTLFTTLFSEQLKLAVIRKRSERPRCTTEQGPQLAASLNSTRKTPVSTSTVKRRLRDAGFLGRVAKKKPYLKLPNKNKRLKMGKRTQNTGQRKIGKKCYGQTNLKFEVFGSQRRTFVRCRKN